MSMKLLKPFVALALAGGCLPAIAEELPLSGAVYRNAEQAYAAYARGDYDEAVRQAREAVRLRPDVAALRDLLRNAESAKRAASAVPAAPVRVAPPRPVAGPAAPRNKQADRTQQAWQAGDAAYKAYNSGAFEQAATLARQSLTLGADNAALHALLVYALEKQERLDAAVEAAAAAVSRFPDDAMLSALLDRLRRRQATVPAAEAWRAYERKDYAGALQAADQAIALAPDVAGYRYLQITSLLELSKLAQARQAASAALEQDELDVQALSMRAYAAARDGDKAAAEADLQLALAQDWVPEDQMAALKRMAGQIRTAPASMPLPGVFCTGEGEQMICSVALGGSVGSPAYMAADQAYKAYASGDYRAAAAAVGTASEAEPDNVGYRVLHADALAMSGQQGAARAELQPLQSQQVPADQLLAAGYAAQRAYRNDWAATWFSEGVDAIDAGQLSQDPKVRRNLTEAISDLERQWGFNAALGYGTVGVMNPAFAPSLSARKTLQASQEVFWRPPVIGNRNGGRVELYARMGQALYDGTGGATGMSTNQAVLGARWKPFRTQNVVVAVERFLRVGDNSRNDWLLRAAWSEGRGGGLRQDVKNWSYWQVYAEADRFTENPQTLGTLDVRYGRAFRMDQASPRLVVVPYAGVTGGYDNLLARKGTLGVGPGVLARYWFRGDSHHAERSFVELNLQYRLRVAGDDRSKGMFAGLYFSY